MSDPANVTLLALDVDGVLTDGSVFLTEQGEEIKRFNVRDGLALAVWRKLGFQAAIISGRCSGAVDARAFELGIELVEQNVGDKVKVMAKVAKAAGIGQEQAAFIGDDWPDLGVMRSVAYPIAVGDADPAVKRAAAYVTAAPGGRGAVREAIEHILAAKGLMDRALALYDQVHG